jgi:hypothetical protein
MSAPRLDFFQDVLPYFALTLEYVEELTGCLNNAAADQPNLIHTRCAKNVF